MRITCVAANHPLRDLKFRRLTRRLHRLGERPIGELLIELAIAHDIEGDVLRRLEKFAEFDERVLDVFDGRRWPPLPIHEVAA
jgi:hypothetical protein